MCRRRTPRKAWALIGSEPFARKFQPKAFSWALIGSEPFARKFQPNAFSWALIGSETFARKFQPKAFSCAAKMMGVRDDTACAGGTLLGKPGHSSAQSHLQESSAAKHLGLRCQSCATTNAQISPCEASIMLKHYSRMHQCLRRRLATEVFRGRIWHV